MQPGIAERQAAQRAHLLLELVGDAGVDRVMPAVVRARRDLVDQQLSLADEELDAENTNVIELARQRQREFLRFGTQAVRDPRWRNAHIENAVAMPVLGDREATGLSVVATRQHHRDLDIERQELLEHAGSRS